MIPHAETPVGPVPHGPGRPHNVAVRLPGTRHRWAALVLPAVSVASLGATVVADVAAPARGPGVELAAGYGWPYAAIGLVFGLCSGAVLFHDRRQAFGWALGLLALFWGLDGSRRPTSGTASAPRRRWPASTRRCGSSTGSARCCPQRSPSCS